jgi:hypothetical protein
VTVSGHYALENLDYGTSAAAVYHGVYSNHPISISCHSERSEESMRSVVMLCSLPWILHCVQNDKPV